MAMERGREGEREREIYIYIYYLFIYLLIFIPEKDGWLKWQTFFLCVARVPVSLWGSGGWGCVRSTLRLRSQPSATVCNRSRDCYVAVPMVSSAEGVIFGCFKRLVASFRVAGVALRDIQTFFVTCGKSFVWQAQYFCDVSRRCVAVFVAGARVVLRVFCESHWQGCVKCRFRGRRGILWDVLKMTGSLPRSIDFEVNLEVPRKTRRKTSILKLQSVKIGGGLARNARFASPTCLVSSLWFSCGLAVSMREAAKHVLVESFQAGCHVVLRGRRGTLWHSNLFDNVSKVESVKLSGSLARNARFAAPTCLVSSLWFSCGVTVSMGEAAKTSPFRRFPSRLSCRFAWQAWHFVTFQPVW